MDSGFWILDFGDRVQAGPRAWLLGIGFLGFGFWIHPSAGENPNLDSEIWILDSGFWILATESKLVPKGLLGIWFLGFGFWIHPSVLVKIQLGF